MAFKCADRIKEITTTEGTGAIQLAGAVAGFKAFSSYLANNDTTYYSIEDTLGNWENGYGTYQTGTPDSILRTNIISSSNNNLIVNFGTGNKNIFCTNPADGTTLIEVDGVNDPVIKTDANIKLGSPVDYIAVIDGIYLNQNRSISWSNNDATTHSGVLQATYDSFNDINRFYVNAPGGAAYTEWNENGIVDFNANGVEFSVGTPISTNNGCPVTLGDGDFISPDGLLNIYTDSDNYTALNIFGVRSTVNVEAAEIKIEKNRGSKTTPSATISGDTLGYLRFAGNDGTSTRNASYIQVEQDAAVSTGPISSIFKFYNGNGTSYTQTLSLSDTTADFQATDITTTGSLTGGGILATATSTLVTIQDDVFRLSGFTGDNAEIDVSGTTGKLRLTGGNNVNGGLIDLHGSTHATRPSDILFYGGGGIELEYDHSASIWDFQDNDIILNAGTYQSSNPAFANMTVATSSLRIGGGDEAFNGANINLYGQNHATQAYDVEIFAGASTPTLVLDYSASTWDFQANNITTTGNITGNKLSIDNNAGTTGTEVFLVTADIGTNDRPYRLFAPETDSLTAPFIWATNNSHMFRVDSTDALEIDSTGDSDFKTRKIFNGHINLEATTVASLPSAASNTGDMYRVTDANAPSMGATVSGGGSANAMVWSNGTNWTVFGI
jgi:hypothetical protein